MLTLAQGPSTEHLDTLNPDRSLSAFMPSSINQPSSSGGQQDSASQPVNGDSQVDRRNGQQSNTVKDPSRGVASTGSLDVGDSGNTFDASAFYTNADESRNGSKD
jgi:hypothetical protein